ncbi:MAG: hypothetical protein FJY06_02025 [Bacteroidetes bacterium]|nr:hypothetical protein [Bacteroidota bacterium]
MELHRNLKGLSVVLNLILTLHVSSQNLPINWGPLEMKRGTLIDISPIRSADFYALRYSGSLLGSYRLNTYNQLAFVSQQRIKPVTESGLATVETSAFFAEKFQVFLSDRMGTTMTLYSQSILDGEENMPSEIRCSYEDKRMGARPNFELLQSQNQQFLAITYEIPGRRTNRDIHGYVLFDSTFTEIGRGEYLLPFDGNMSTINQNHITNRGEYLIAVTEHKNPNDRFFGRSWENFKAFHIYKIKKDSLQEFNLELSDKRIDDLTMSSNNTGLVSITGLYGRGNNNGIEGVFSVNMDTNKDSIISYKYSPFDRSIFQNSRSEIQLTNFIRRNNNRGENPQVFSYKLRQIQTLEDNSQVGYLEQYFERQFTNYDSRTGVTTVNNYYYYLDIIVFKLSPDGTYLWGSKIPKNQITMNDNGPFSSFVGFNNQRNAYVLFNDNKRNYNDDGTFSRNSDNSGIYGLNLSAWRNVVALVTIDLATGNLERNTMFSRKELSAIAVPKTMKVDWKNQEVLMYAVNRNREKFGLISFK